MRQTFVSKLLDFAVRYPELMVVSGDLGYSVFEPFMAQRAGQFLNVGIAEQDMIGISAGLALSGKKVFAYSITPFSTVRPLEQIRMDVCYHNLPVRIIGTGAGLSYGTLGPSHHGTEDLALMRAMPNMVVCAPADKHELAALMDFSMRHAGPLYMRIGRASEPDVHKAAPTLKFGEGLCVLNEGNDFAILACGNMVFNSMEAARLLTAKGKRGQVYSMPFVKPLDSALVLKLGARLPLFTVEEHSIMGGLGSAVAEALADGGVKPPAFQRFALPDAFQKKVGKHDYLRQLNGLTAPQIAASIAKKLE
ncbi:1-deoxy-D-xylulose-5-phosphate synthase [uncultured archaeon]|nr:1-deoxy-D-xylulose-5-phosphate synthase [uncultured archaeon]